MRLPRRVPWASTAELDQVCAWVYQDEHDVESKRLAVNRLSAWKAITSLPHAIESTLSLLVAILQDRKDTGNTVSYLSVRQSYATAIIRLVNGLVDPLQFGVYARSIASIANQLGLPLWLVEIRHAATHEDLPSIEVLREGARQSMSWLLHNYWLPTINPSTDSQQTDEPLSPLTPVLKQYKALMKTTTRDASLKSKYRQSLQAVLQDVERWLSEARVSANAASGSVAWESDDEDWKERWALDRLCDALLEKGALVPLSRKKRVQSSDGSFLPSTFSIQLWSSLLQQMQSSHPDLAGLLISRILLQLTIDQQLTEHPNGTIGETLPDMADPSYEACLARWAMWTMQLFDSEECDLLTDAAVSLLTALGPVKNPRRKAAYDLLEAMCAVNPRLSAALSTLLPPTSPSVAASMDTSDDTIALMHSRLQTLIASTAAPKELRAETDASQVVNDTRDASKSSDLPLGWKLLDERSGWKPCPIGAGPTAAPG